MKGRLTEEDEQNIIKEIKEWTGKKGALTFPSVIKMIEEMGLGTISRQALYKRKKIRIALEDRRNYLRLPSSKRGMAHEMDNAMSKIEKIELENKFLKEQNKALKEKFIRWQYNAHRLNRTEDELEQPIEEGIRKTLEELNCQLPL